MSRVLFNFTLFILLACSLKTQAAAPEDDLLATMTLEQKVAQMIVASFYGTALPEETAIFLRDWQPGSIILLPANLQDPAQVTRLTNQIQQTLVDSGAPPALIGINQEGGSIAALRDGFTAWPSPALLAATQDTELAYQVGQAIATELRAVGINMNYAPVADLRTNPDNPIINRRAYGSDPALVAPILGALIDGLQSGGVLATAKHFPGHGDTDSDSHLEMPVISDSQTSLAAREIIPFQAAIEADVAAMMVAHIHFTAYEPDEARPASLSQNVVTGLLREQLGYDGIIMTDALDMDAIDTVYTPQEATLQAVIAGHDLILPGPHISAQSQIAAIQTVVAAVRDGRISEDRIDASVRRILAAKARFGLLDWQPLALESAAERLNLDAHAELVDRQFERGITLARNEDDLIPVSDERVLFIYPGTRPSLWRACQREGWQPMSVNLSPSDEQIAAAVQNAALVQTVIVVVDDAITDEQQRNLLRSLPVERAVLVAISSPDDAALVETAAALVTYSSLFALHEPLCAILHGDQPSQGTLPLALQRR